MDAIDDLLTRGVDQIYPSREALEKVLRSGKKLRLYQGFDPTGTQLHIGHAVGFRKLRQWQDLGHEVIFLIGDGTGQAGDPTGKKKTRDKFFSRDELRQNGRDYVLQAGKIVRFNGVNPVKILYNSDWLNSLNLVNILDLAQHFSVQQLIERDMFQERIKKGESINLREFLYPLLQGYDSVAMNVDLELGGSDQTFNMLCGRTLVGYMLGKEKFVMTTPLLVDAKGTKIGKTEGNVIGLTDPAAEFFGKIMSLGDEAILPCFSLLTDTHGADIEEMNLAMQRGENPMIFKKRLAFTLTGWLNGEQEAVHAQEQFELTFQKRTIANADLPVVSLASIRNSDSFVDILVFLQAAVSKSEARRLIDQGAVELNSTRIIHDDIPQLKTGDILKIGKKKFYKFGGP